MKIQVLLIILAITFAYGNQSVDIENDLLYGKVSLTEENAKILYFKYRPLTAFTEEFEHFLKSLQQIIKHNSNPARTFEMGITQFSFISDKEFMSQFLGAQNCSATAELSIKNSLLKPKRKIQDIPAAKDWRDAGIITQVKDQRNCGSCWTFSATGCLEAHWALKYSFAPRQFSEQQLIDCAGAFNNKGCSGGLPSQAFEYIRFAGGLADEGRYPYYGIDGQECSYSHDNRGAHVPGGSNNITAYDEDELLQTVGAIGPVSIAFQVLADFKNYVSGVYQNPNCSSSPSTVNHAVLAVGYGDDNGTPYWMVKNSWSKNWGDQGYFKILRGKNMCGVATCAAYPNLDAI